MNHDQPHLTQVEFARFLEYHLGPRLASMEQKLDIAIRNEERIRALESNQQQAGLLAAKLAALVGTVTVAAIKAGEYLIGLVLVKPHG